MLNHKKVQKVLLIILEGLTYLSFLMPFVFLDNSIFPFIVGKVVYFEAVVQLMAAVYLLLLTVNFQQFKPRKNLLLYWFGFYALSIFLSAVFGIDFNRAFWSNFERMTGVFMVFHCLVYAVIVSVVFNTPEKIKRAIQIFLGAGLIEVAVTLAQYVKPGVFLYANTGGRVWGTLGNSIYIGSYFLFHIFLALYLAFKEKKQIWQVAYLSIAILEGYIIVHSKSSRGADLALEFAAIFGVCAYAFLSKNKKLRMATVVIVICGTLFGSGALLFRNTNFVRNFPVAGKAIVALKEGTGRTRLIAWGIAVQAFKERPILGWGLENFYYAFNKYYNPESLRYSYYETWFDRSHSVIFDTLSSGGAIGFISYFGLFAVAGYLLYSLWRKGTVDKHSLVFFIIIFSTYLIQILFVFDHPSSYLLLYFSLGLVLSLVSGKREETEPKYALTGASFAALTVVIFIGFLIIFFSTSVRTIKAAVGIIDAEKVFVQDYRAGLEKYKEIFALRTPFIYDMRLAMAKRVAEVGPGVLKTYPDYAQAVLFARDEMLKQTKERNNDVYDYLVLGQIDELLASTNQKYFDSAEEFLAKARELSPKRQQIYYSWARIKAARGDLAGAIGLVSEALSFDPQIADSYWYLGLLYDSQGNNTLAWNYIKGAVDRAYSWKSPQEINFAIGLGEKLKKDADLPPLYQAAIDQNPTAENYARLGNVYNRLGEKDKAVEAYMKAQQINPDLFKKK